MRLFSEKYRLLTWISILLIGGFLTTIIASYIVSRDAIRQNVVEQALPLTSDNIYSEIQKDILRPVFISSLMASDTFLRDWIIAGETDITQIKRYLKEVKEKYNTITSFLVSENTQNYYYAGGLLKAVKKDEPRDTWFYRVREMKTDYETNVDNDMANRDTMTIFINHRVFDYDGKFIGATGVGLTLDTMTAILDSYQKRFHRNIYFTDDKGEIKIAGKSMKNIHGSISKLPGVSSIAKDILNRDTRPTQLEYQHDGATILMSSRFIPELDWYLLVEQDITDDVRPIERVFFINIIVSAIVTLLILALTLLAVNRYQRRLEIIAGTDALTGLLNRQAFEIVFQQAILDSERRRIPLSVILFDIDFFKMVNDNHGHLTGDRVLKDIASITKGAVRESDIVTRWGGEEFLVLLKDCPLEKAAALAEKIRVMIASHDFELGASELCMTTSLGVVEYAYRETWLSFFGRADKALYQAKNEGRNRVVASSSPATPAAQ
ncbi:sensor domain-containing diguanylate cyclase [Herminiimonas aquatilis]|uniref:diguanylate cyclase n=1 Tax=Herminiimonas aquatilis TaxID=345342 RepID=A0ABW2J535_9BURK